MSAGGGGRGVRPSALMVLVLRRMLVVALLAGGAWTGAVVPAAAPAAASVDACDDYDLDDGETLVTLGEAVDEVFVGRVRVSEPRDGGQRADGRPRPRVDSRGWVHRVTVVIGLQGEAGLGEVFTVVTAPRGEEGLGQLDEGATYLFFADRLDGSDRLSASRCGGTTVLPRGLGADLERELKQVFDDTAAPEPTPVTLSEPAGGTDEPPALGRSVAPGVAISLVGVLGLLLFWRLGRRRP